MTTFKYRGMVRDLRYFREASSKKGRDQKQKRKSGRHLKGTESVQRAEKNLENETIYIVRLKNTSHSEK